MRIVGNGKDYYDGIAAYYSDDDIVWVRGRVTESQPEKIKFNIPDRLSISSTTKRMLWRREKQGESLPVVKQQVVWFAGKMYRGVRTEKNGDFRYFWNVDDAQKYLAMHDLKLFVHDWWQKERRSVEEYFGLIEPTVRQSELLFEHNIAVAISVCSERDDLDQWYINTDGLKVMDFAKVVDPYQAFQEIAMYVGGVLPRTGNPTIEITDSKMVARKHGFNEWSFRKQGSKSDIT